MADKPRLNLPVSYEIGYAKPPAQTRFKPGQSGNPRGRPKGRKVSQEPQREEYLKSIILDEAYRKVKVNDGNRKLTMTMAQAAVRSLAIAAGKGNTRAQKIFADLIAKTESSRKAHYDQWLQAAIEYKTEWEHNLEWRKTKGIIAADPIPHPEDIVINFSTDTVEVRGPMSKEEEDEIIRLLQRKKTFEKENSFLSKMLKRRRLEKQKEFFEQEIQTNNKILGLLDKAIGRRAGPKCLARLASRIADQNEEHVRR